jgi:hypothetical protein
LLPVFLEHASLWPLRGGFSIFDSMATCFEFEEFQRVPLRNFYVGALKFRIMGHPLKPATIIHESGEMLRPLKDALPI